MISTNSIMDPKVISSIGGLHIAAKRLVDGFLAGLHRSSHQGFNVEFTEHRAFQPGDDPKNLDWKVLCRTDRYYIKQYEEDTSLRAIFLLDRSASMSYGNKWIWASVTAACLSYLAIRQGDSAGLALSGQNAAIIPPRSSMSHLTTLLKAIENVRVQGRETLASSINALGNNLKRRSLVVIIGDLLEEPEKFIQSAGLLRHEKHDLLVIQTLDEDELNFPFHGSVLFTDLETPSRMLTSADGIKDEYLKAIHNHVDSLRSSLTARDIDYLLLSTGTPVEKALSSYLAKRMRG